VKEKERFLIPARCYAITAYALVSALEVDNFMRYINLLLTYLLTTYYTGQCLLVSISSSHVDVLSKIMNGSSYVYSAYRLLWANQALLRK